MRVGLFYQLFIIFFRNEVQGVTSDLFRMLLLCILSTIYTSANSESCPGGAVTPETLLDPLVHFCVANLIGYLPSHF